MNSQTTTEVTQGPPHVHHMDAPTAYQSAKLGMWLFLATEILLFGGLFCAFAIYRYLYLEEFTNASLLLDWRMGAINTVFLIFSSFTAALAVDAAQHGNNAGVRRNFLISIGCGFIFLVVKYFEYKSKAHHNLFPYGDLGFANVLFAGALFFAACYFLISFFCKYKIAVAALLSLALVVGMFFMKDSLAHLSFDLAKVLPFAGDKAAHYIEFENFRDPAFSNEYKSYFGLYYCMTGLHALHVIIGMAILFWAYIKATRDRYSADYYTPVEVGALYWHLVDLIWIYLFPLLYLVG